MSADRAFLQVSKNRKNDTIMNRFSLFGIGLLAIAVSSTIFAQEQTEEQPPVEQAAVGNFSLNLGVSWRNFKATKFRNTTPNGYKGVFSRSDADGMVEDYSSNFSKIGVSHRDEAVIVYKDAGKPDSKKDVDTSDKFAPAIGIGYQFWQKNSLSLSAVMGFQYYELDKDSSGVQGGENSSYQTIIPGIPAAPERDSHETDYLASSARTKFDMSLYSFDLGLRFDYSPNSALKLFASAGPTLAIADMESTTSNSITRNVDGTRLEGGRNSSGSRDWIWGIYASCGAEVMFTKHFGASAEIRYDNAFDSADTKYAVQTLDSFGGMIKLVWRF